MRHLVLPLFCVGFDEPTVPDGVRPLLAEGLGGVILFSRNLLEVEQICRLTAELHAAASAPLLVGVDQEGGRVTRLPAPFLAPPSASTLGDLDDETLTADLARAMGRELLAAGFTWNLAPVLDVRTNPANPVIGDRAYSHDPDRVARLGIRVIQGLTDAGILASAKHFPGHGETVADSHLTLPVSPQPEERWRAVEFVPFRRAIQAGVSTTLVAHLVCPALDPEAPSSLSHRIITGILREELGFDGVVVSDDLEMEAIAARYPIGEAAVRFLEAGGDLILICHQAARQEAAMTAVESAVRSGRLTETRLHASLGRLARLRQRMSSGRGQMDLQAARAIIGSENHQRLLQKILIATENRRRKAGNPDG
ncbi:MAG TPA: beta-N-acetylhexosaminidase [Candidatus Acidoferrum sp.]|nr:beta-N-acetylhexosaminidase [Candidatus Acidoferrum sp.]